MSDQSVDAAAPGKASRTPRFGARARVAAAVLLLVVTTPIALVQSPRPDPLAARGGLDWLLEPYERNAFLRLPELGGNLLDVAVVGEGMHVWAVGQDGLAVHSADGGRTWRRHTIRAGDPAAAAEPLARAPRRSWPAVVGTAHAEEAPSPPASGRKSVEAPAARQQGTAKAPPAQETEPAAAPPAQPTDPVEAPPEPSPPARNLEREAATELPEASPDSGVFESLDLLAVHFVDPLRGWVTREDGAILLTTDGGETWEAAAVRGMGLPLHDIVVFADGRGMAVGEEGQILRTADGRRWEFGGGGDASLRAIAFADAQRGAIVGDGDPLFTSNGGRDWQQVLWPEYARMSDIALLPDGRGVAVGEGGAIWLTETAGETWRSVPSGSDANLDAVALQPDGRGWAVGREVLLRTSDAGLGWDVTPMFVGGVGTTTAPGGVGYLVGSLGIEATDDGGVTWALHSRPALFDVWLGDDGRALAAGQAGTLLESDDGGRTWTGSRLDDVPALAAMDADASGALAVAGGPTAMWRRADGSGAEVGEGPWRDDSAVDVAVRGGRAWVLTSDGGIFEGGDDASWRRIGWLSPGFGWQALHVMDGGTMIAAGAPGFARSEDGGRTWSQAASDRFSYYGVRFADAQRGVAVGDAVQLSEDGGLSWSTVQVASWPALLFGIDAADARRWIAVGRGGAVLTSADGGRSWTARPSGSERVLLDVAARSDGRVLAVGQAGTVLRSEDFGATWTQPGYARFPAPWYLGAVALAVGLGLAGALRTMEPRVRETSIADVAASDRPLRWDDPDPLGFHEIAAGLSRFLRNDRTEPPLTISVTGEWGTGKSSIMGLLREDLRRSGFRPVWFNAWHHQKGEHLLASLFANVRSQALPTLLTREGLRFRTQLLLLRGWRRLVTTALLLFLLALGIGYFYDQPEQLSNLARWLAPGASAAPSARPANALAVFVTTFLAPGLGLLRAVRAFGLEPGRLVNAVSDRSPRRERPAPGARYRFAQEFHDVTRALRPYTMVIFIDDLDRCSKEHVVEILEAVNFLVTSGDCYVVLGMAPEWVTTCVALQFRELSSKGRGSQALGEKEMAFARQYLEKLINIEVPVPPLEGRDSIAMLPEAGSASPPRPGARRWLDKWGRAAVPWAAAASVLLGGWLASDRLPAIGAPRGPEEKASPSPVAEVRLGQGGVQVVLPVHRGEASRKDKEGVVIGRLALGGTPADLVMDLSSNGSTGGPLRLELAEAAKRISLRLGGDDDGGAVEAGAQGRRDPVFGRSLPEQEAFFVPAATGDARWLAAAALLGLAGVLGSAVLSALRRPPAVVRDSEAFATALRVWHPWIVARRSTPRAIKRFLNRVRYLAMRQRGDRPGSSAPGAEARADGTIPEPTLVALSAIHHYDAAWVEDDGWWRYLSEASGTPVGELKPELARAIQEHQRTFSEWPISDEARRRFLRGRRTVVAH